jgi:hypothetical protein
MVSISHVVDVENEVNGDLLLLLVWMMMSLYQTQARHLPGQESHNRVGGGIIL